MNKRGFTLIELLSVIIILAIISLIAVPTLTKILDNIKKDTAYNSAIGLIDSTNYYYSRNTRTPYKDNKIIFECDGKDCHNSNDETISTKGKAPLKGQIELYQNGDILLNYVALNDGYCAYGNKENLKIKKMHCDMTEVPGLYNSNNELIISWYDLEENYNLSVEKYYTTSTTRAGKSYSDLYSRKSTDPYSLSYIIYNNPELEEAVKLVVDSDVKTIGGRALAYLKNIKEIVLPDGLNSIDSYAFYECENLENLIIPETVEEIFGSIFDGDDKLTNIVIPKNVNYLDKISSNPNFNFKISKDNPYYEDLDSNYIIQKKDKILVSAGNNTVIPSDIKQIAFYAFRNNDKIVNLKIPDNVEKIDSYAFKSCPNLKSIELPKNLKYIDIRFYDDCPKLESISIDSSNQYLSTPNSNIVIYKSDNSVVTALKNATIPNGVNSISIEALNLMENENIVIPSSVNEIIKNNTYRGKSNITFENPNGWYKAVVRYDTEGESVDVVNTSFKDIFNTSSFSRLKRNTSS